MQQRRLGRTGLMVSELVLGTMSWGRDTDEDQAAAQLRDFFDAAGTLVDTSDSYADGESERMIGRLLGDVVPRAELLVATKAGAPAGPGSRAGGSSRGHLLAALDASLERLQTSYVDLWQLQGWDDVTPLEETLSTLDAAVTSGRVRYIGVCNYTGWQTAKAAAWQASWPGRTPLASTSVEYSLLERGVEREVVPAAVDAGLGVLPWSPLGRGVLTGKYRSRTPIDSRGATPAYARWVAPYLDERCARVVQAVVTAADGLGVSPLAVALAWLRDRPGVVAPVVGARTASQLRESLESTSVTLPVEISAALSEVSAPALGCPEPGLPTHA